MENTGPAEFLNLDKELIESCERGKYETTAEIFQKSRSSTKTTKITAGFPT